jgi:DNA polymerase-3 subunit gamma/tau
LYYQIGLIGRRDLPLSPEPRGGFEMVMLRMLAFRPGAAANATAPGASVTARPVPAATPARSAPEKPAPGPASTASAGSGSKPAPAAASGAGEWSAVIEALPVKGMVREMALNCAFHELENDTVQLSLDPVHKHLLSKGRVEQLEAALGDYYQRSITVKLLQDGALEGETPARKQTREQDERQQRAVQSIETDANIKAIQDAFGGTVSQDTIRPRD